MTRTMNALRRFRRAEDGTLAFDFVLWFPLFLFLMLLGIEVGLVAIKSAKLERSVDETVRWVRLNTGASPTIDDIRTKLCSTNPVSDCAENIRVEMIKTDLRNWQSLPDQYACVDAAETIDPMDRLSLGMDNELMVLRVCATYNLLIDKGLVGSFLQNDSDNQYITKSAAFVQEPR